MFFLNHLLVGYQLIYIRSTLRYLQQVFLSEMNLLFDNYNVQRVLLFILFIILLLIAAFLCWTPFLSQLNKEVHINFNLLIVFYKNHNNSQIFWCFNNIFFFKTDLVNEMPSFLHPRRRNDENQEHWKLHQRVHPRSQNMIGFVCAFSK